MKIKDIVHKLSNRSSENKETEIPDVEFTFGNITKKDVGTLNVNDFKNKCEKETEKLIKNISSMSKDECEKKDAYLSKILKEIREVPRIIRFARDLSTKHQFFYSCLKKYQNELRKKIKELS